MTGRFITLEGGEGAGKSTQARRLAAWLEDAGQALPRHPRARRLAGARRRSASSSSTASPDAGDALTETLLLFAARADHVARTIRPALDADRFVICDRFTDSTYAYQGVGREMPRETIRRIESVVLDDFKPELTLMLDLPVETGLARARARGAEESRFEGFDAAFHERLRQPSSTSPDAPPTAAS